MARLAGLTDATAGRSISCVTRRWVSLVLVPPRAETVSRPSSTRTAAVVVRYSSAAVALKASIPTWCSMFTACVES